MEQFDKCLYCKGDQDSGQYTSQGEWVCEECYESSFDEEE